MSIRDTAIQVRVEDPVLTLGHATNQTVEMRPRRAPWSSAMRALGHDHMHASSMRPSAGAMAPWQQPTQEHKEASLGSADHWHAHWTQTMQRRAPSLCALVDREGGDVANMASARQGRSRTAVRSLDCVNQSTHMGADGTNTDAVEARRG